MAYNIYSPGTAAIMQSLLGRRVPINPMSYDAERESDLSLGFGRNLLRGTGNPRGTLSGAVRDVGDRLIGAFLAGKSGQKYNDLEDRANSQWAEIMKAEGGLQGMQDVASGYGASLDPKVAQQIAIMKQYDALDSPNRDFQREQWEWQKQQADRSFRLQERALNNRLSRFQGFMSLPDLPPGPYANEAPTWPMQPSEDSEIDSISTAPPATPAVEGLGFEPVQQTAAKAIGLDRQPVLLAANGGVFSDAPSGYGQSSAKQVPQRPQMPARPTWKGYTRDTIPAEYLAHPGVKNIFDELDRREAAALKRYEVESKAYTGEEKAGLRRQQAVRAGNIVLDEIGRVLPMTNTWTTGALGQALSFIPGTQSHDVSALLDTIKGNIGFDKLQQLRESSPTGGALGQVSNYEIQNLQAVLGSLKQSQTADQFSKNLKRLRNVYLSTIHGEEAAANIAAQIEAQEGFGDNGSPYSSMSDEDLLRRIGGQ